VHRIGRTGRAKKKGVSWTVIGSFPEQAKLDEIAKYCHFTVQPMAITEGGMIPVERRQAAPAARRRR
jgi:ATP-dependent RNA helicase DeaD